MKLQLIFLGAPGSGKGTQAKRMAKSYNFEHVSTGDLLRSEIGRKSELGLKVEKVVQEGHLVSDEIVNQLIENNCDLESKSYIFDGYPRNISQVVSFIEQIIKSGPYKAIYLDISHDVLVDRLTQRRICSKCGAIYNLSSNPPQKDGHCDKCLVPSLMHRKDDQEETIRERLAVYQDSMIPVLEYFDKQNSLIRVDASAPADEVFKEIEKVLEL